MKNSTDISTSPYINFLQNIHSTVRRTIETNLFKKPTKITLLDFVGANDYFITDFGAIWTRNRVYPNRFNILTRGYLPLVIKDPYYPYPWVLLPTSAGKIWFPVNQLLGWGFSPYVEVKKQYFFPEYLWLWSQHHSAFSWQDTLDRPLEGMSLFHEFMDTLYENV